MDSFTAAYVHAALWSSLDEEDKPLDARFTASDLAPKFLAEVTADCEAFQQGNIELLRAAYRLRGYNEVTAGYDFWFTRNRHGAGFWDRDGLPKEVAGALTEAAHAYDSVDLYVDGPLVDSL